MLTSRPFLFCMWADTPASGPVFAKAIFFCRSINRRLRAWARNESRNLLTKPNAYHLELQRRHQTNRSGNDDGQTTLLKLP